jgi:uncharacterized protein (TIGR03435 family)
MGRGFGILLLSAYVFVAPIAFLHGQVQPDQKPLAFEVASIKRNVTLAEGGSIGMQPGGRFRAVNADLRSIISVMYRTSSGARLFPSQIIGLPDWAAAEKYDITAKVGEALAGRPVQEQFRNMAPMVQSLLADRFELTLHRETREMPIYALVVLRPNVIRPTTTDCRATPDKCDIQSTAGHFAAVALNMNDMLSVLSNAVERVVVNRTGLQGSYDIDIDWAAEPGSDKPSIFTAVQEQLGLKLESTRGAVDVVVIDHVERPTPD